MHPDRRLEDRHQGWREHLQQLSRRRRFAADQGHDREARGMMRFAKILRGGRRLVADEAGTSVLELALCTPILVTFLVGIIDVAMFAGAKLQAEQAIYRGLEIIQVNLSRPDTATVQSEVAAAAGSRVRVANVTVDQELWCKGTDDASYVKQDDYAGACNDGDAVARYLNVSADAAYEPFLPALTSRFMGTARDDGKIPFTVAAAVRIQ